MKVIIFEGTPEEFARAKPDLLGTHPDAVVVTERTEGPVQSVDTSTNTLNKQIVMRVLTRRPLSPNLRKVLKALLKADTNGLSTKEIAKTVGINRQELAGVFGAFGRRMANTPGWPDGVSIVGYAQEYNDDAGKEEWRYWLQPAVREILENGAVRL